MCIRDREAPFQVLSLVLPRLPARDRRLLSGHLRGEGAEALAESTGLPAELVQRALSRALRRARKLLAREPEPELG